MRLKPRREEQQRRRLDTCSAFPPLTMQIFLPAFTFRNVVGELQTSRVDRRAGAGMRRNECCAHVLGTPGFPRSARLASMPCHVCSLRWHLPACPLPRLPLARLPAFSLS